MLILGLCLPFTSQIKAVQAEDAPSGQEQTTAAEPSAQETTPQEQNLTVRDIRVQGNQIIGTNTILNKMSLRKGVQLSQEAVNEDIKRLYGTGFFRDIRFDVEPYTDGIDLIVVVDEKPVVKEILIDGNQTFDDRKLRKDIDLLEGQIVDERLVVEGVRKIEARYLNKGFRFVKVSYNVQVNDFTKEATVLVHVNEGESYRIKEVKFSGVKAFSERQLRKLLRTKKKSAWNPFQRGVFKEDEFQDDLERVSVFYQDEGYLDAKVSSDFEYDEASNRIVITILAEEGARYQAGSVQFEGNQLFPESDIWERLKMLPSTTYSQRNLALDIDAIRKLYFAHGYLDVRVTPQVEFHRGESKADVKYAIKEGDLYFVDKVKIRGNTKTKDIVIRRELRIKPGERFDGDLLELSKQRLENLGFFEDVTYDTEPGSAPNRKDVVFRVKEKQTGELSFGAGFSSIDQFIGFAEIAQRNFDLLNWPRFTGAGQNIALSGRIGSISRNIEFSFLEPYIFNRNVSFGLEAYNRDFERRNLDFDHERRGVGFTIAKALNDFVKIGTGYTLERVKVTDIQDSASSLVFESEGSDILSRLKIFITRDTRDSVFNPTKGSVMGFSAELIGTFLGGDADFTILQANATKYWRIGETGVLEWRNRLAMSEGFRSTDNVPIYDRFFAGGLGTVRGYNFRRVSPKDDNRPIGGEFLAITNIEYTFPLPVIENFKGAFFIDIAQITRDASKPFEGRDLVASIGPGVKIKTPLGPIALYYGLPILHRDTEDKNGRFEFSLSRSF